MGDSTFRAQEAPPTAFPHWVAIVVDGDVNGFAGHEVGAGAVGDDVVAAGDGCEDTSGDVHHAVSTFMIGEKKTLI